MWTSLDSSILIFLDQDQLLNEKFQKLKSQTGRPPPATQKSDSQLREQLDRLQRNPNNTAISEKKPTTSGGKKSQVDLIIEQTLAQLELEKMEGKAARSSSDSLSSDFTDSSDLSESD